MLMLQTEGKKPTFFKERFYATGAEISQQVGNMIVLYLNESEF